jgi:hypothetical protein
MRERFDCAGIETALKRLGEIFQWHREVEILLVGGAAGMITGVLPAMRTTMDCDVMKYIPEAAWIAVETAAEEVAKELGLPEHWLNSDVQIRADSLPADWQERSIWHNTYGSLKVVAVSRIDLITMKFLAHRPQDLEDLLALGVTEEDKAFTRKHLDRIEAAGSNQKEIAEAREYISAWEIVK